MAVRVGDICTKASSAVAQKEIESCDGTYPIYGASGLIKRVNFYHQEKPYIAIVKDGAGVGRVMKLPGKSSIIGTMQYIIPNDEVDVSYLAYALEHMNLAKYYTGATIPHIYFKDYCNEELPPHTPNDQRHIAAVLDKVSNLISLRKQQLVKLDDLAKVRFVEMFKKCEHRDFIGNVTTISRGASPRPISEFITDDPGGVNWIKIGDASENALYITHTSEKITLEGSNRSRYVHKGDFILSNSMSFGRPYILDIDGCVHDGWLIISDYSSTFQPLYLYYAIRDVEVQNQFSGKVNGATVKNLNSDLVKGTLIKVPPMALQRQFAEFVLKVEGTKLTIQQSLDKLELLKKSLMQKYFGEK